MATVLNTKCKSLKHPSFGEPYPFLESEGDHFIKELAHKQSDTHLTLENHLKLEKEFKAAYNYLPVTEFSTGASSLNEFISVANKDEISINKSINEETTTNAENTGYESRHIRELAMCVKPNSLETKLLQFAMSCQKNKKKTDARPPDHPINNLNEILDDRFSYLSKPSPNITAKTVARKRRQLLESLSQPIGPKPKASNVDKQRSSLWDVMEPVSNNKPQTRHYTCKSKSSKRFYTIQNNKIVPYDSKNINCNKRNDLNEPFVSVVDDSTTNCDYKNPIRLSVEDIKRLPRFANYERGLPTQVLYIKNLSDSVTEDDLVYLFQKFQKPDEPKLVYRLLKKGKMRGQAFVTFNSIENATEALDKMNGTILKGKPVIIQFGSGKQLKI